MSFYVCIDIGGTAIKYGLAGEDGVLAERGERPALAREEGGEGILRKIIEIVRGYQASHEPVKGIAIDTPGIVDARDGSIVFAANIPDYSGMKLQARVTEACGIPCIVENDVNAAIAGEYWKGAGKGAETLFMITVGTGVGGAFLWNGNVLHGASHAAGEVGFLRLHGEKRIFEDIGSTRALVEQVAVARHVSPAALDGREVFRMAEDGDEAAIAAIHEFAANLAEGIAQVCCLLNPEVIVLGGGVSEQKKWLKAPLQSNVEEMVVPSMRANTRIEFAELGNDAGMIGALYLLLQRMEETERV